MPLPYGSRLPLAALGSLVTPITGLLGDVGSPPPALPTVLILVMNVSTNQGYVVKTFTVVKTRSPARPEPPGTRVPSCHTGTTPGGDNPRVRRQRWFSWGSCGASQPRDGIRAPGRALGTLAAKFFLAKRHVNV